MPTIMLIITEDGDRTQAQILPILTIITGIIGETAIKEEWAVLSVVEDQLILLLPVKSLWESKK